MTSNDFNKYGVPAQKKFPMPDADHVRSAIKFFNYVSPQYEKILARAILQRAKEYGVDLYEMSIGDENRFKKYLPESELKHFGIPGMKWGVRRFQNPDGSLTPEGKRRYERLVSHQKDYEERSKDAQKKISDLEKRGSKSKYYKDQKYNDEYGYDYDHDIDFRSVEEYISALQVSKEGYDSWAKKYARDGEKFMEKLNRANKRK